MSNLLEIFFTRPLLVRRLIGTGPYGAKHVDESSAETVKCRLRHENRLVRDSTGEEVVSRSQASMSVDIGTIPPGSLVQVPGETSWRTTIAEDRHVGGFDQSPDYYSIEIS
ncbi:hypothetical protein [Gordonia malaquae]|uniref:hypothetical protein n=1 Tax=Gordonia malaquae TaxID=410332 RepID=UPI0030FEA06B